MARSRHTFDGFALHIHGEQFVNIANRKNVGVDDHRSALVSHRFRRHETQRGKRLQVIVFPHPTSTVAQKPLSFPRLEKREVFVVQNADVKLIRAP
jgi:hypothetical protein